MKKILFLIGLIFICFQSCDKDGVSNRYLSIETDKQVYTVGENVKIQLTNKHDLPLSYFMCSSYKGIPPGIVKYDNGKWIDYLGPFVCNGYNSGIVEFASRNVYKDTLDFSFEKGTYKVGYKFIVEHGKDYQTFFSKEFRFE